MMTKIADNAATSWDQYFAREREELYPGEACDPSPAAAEKLYDMMMANGVLTLADLPAFKGPAAFLDGVYVVHREASGKLKSRIPYGKMAELARALRELRHSCDIYVLGPDREVVEHMKPGHVAGSGDLAFRFGQWPEGRRAPLMLCKVRAVDGLPGGGVARLLVGCKFPFSNFETPEGFSFEAPLPGGLSMRISNPEMAIQYGQKASGVEAFPVRGGLSRYVANLANFVRENGIDYAVPVEAPEGVAEYMAHVHAVVGMCPSVTPKMAKAIGNLLLPLNSDYFVVSKGKERSTGAILDAAGSLDKLLEGAGLNARTQAAIYLTSCLQNKGFRDMMLAMAECGVGVRESALYERKDDKDGSLYYYLDNSFGDCHLPPSYGPCGNLYSSSKPDVYCAAAHNCMGLGFQIAACMLPSLDEAGYACVKGLLSSQ